MGTDQLRKPKEANLSQNSNNIRKGVEINLYINGRCNIYYKWKTAKKKKVAGAI